MRDHVPPISSEVWGAAYEGGAENDVALRERVFAYLDADPMHFRSGYIKQKLLRQVKRWRLSHDERAILRDLVLRRVRGPAYREFREVCRTIPAIADDRLRTDLEALSRDRNKWVRQRARFALDTFRRPRP